MIPFATLYNITDMAGKARLGMAWRGGARRGRCGTLQLGMAGLGEVSCGSAGKVRLGTVCQGMLWRAKAWQARLGGSWYVRARSGPARQARYV